MNAAEQPTWSMQMVFFAMSFSNNPLLEAIAVNKCVQLVSGTVNISEINLAFNKR